MSKRPIVLAVMFMIGCATGGVASQLVVPLARAGTHPARWEYACVRNPTGSDLNKYGDQGWELATAASGVHDTGGGIGTDVAYCFKRSLEAPATP